jgi:hypothetical protein
MAALGTVGCNKSSKRKLMRQIQYRRQDEYDEKGI